ncbi:MAG: hypothetical protein ACOVQX_04050 [Legionella sp.]
MKTQEQAQEIFNVLVTALQNANDWNLYYVSRKLHASSTIDTPLEHFLKSAREKLTEDDVSESFLRDVYHEAFHTGHIPKNRNHIIMAAGLQVNSGPKSLDLIFWIDLDKVAAQLNTHLQINPPYRFKVKCLGSSLQMMSRCSYNDYLIAHTSSQLNSVPLSMNSYFLIGCIVSGGMSVYALLIATLAVASIVTLSTAGILTAAGVGLVAGGASYSSYCLFKASSAAYTTVEPIEESLHVNIEDIFSKHFAATIDRTISPQDRVELIDDKQALRI